MFFRSEFACRAPSLDPASLRKVVVVGLQGDGVHDHPLSFRKLQRGALDPPSEYRQLGGEAGPGALDARTTRSIASPKR